MNTLYLDTETTGLSPREGAEIVEVAIIDDLGQPLVNSLIKPRKPIPADASRIHGITDEMVRNAPALGDLWSSIERATAGHHVVIYNAAFDAGFFPNKLTHAGKTSCAMLAFAEVYGEPHSTRGGYKWQTLSTAAEYVGYQFDGAAHRALADALACRAVWRWLQK